MPIETFLKKRINVGTMLWDGTPERAAEIKAWVGPHGGDGTPGFLAPGECADEKRFAHLWVARTRQWEPVFIGHRVAAETDGSRFFTLAPGEQDREYETDEPDDETTVQPIGDRITALLPDWTYVRCGVMTAGGKTWTWTTPAGTWSVTSPGMGSLLRLAGPNGELLIGGDDDTRWRRLVGVLRALGAIGEETHDV